MRSVLPTPLRKDPFWAAPMVWLGLGFSVGVVLDATFPIPPEIAFVGAIAALLAWAATLTSVNKGLGGVYLALTTVCLAAAYHHVRVWRVRTNDLSQFVQDSQRGMRVRALLAEGPTISPKPPFDPWVIIPRDAQLRATLEIQALWVDETWLPVSGRVGWILDQPKEPLLLGDELEILGQFSRPRPPANPGEHDRELLFYEKDYSALFHTKSQSLVQVVERQGALSPWMWFPLLRNHLRTRLEELIPDPETSGLAAALLLGDGSGMTQEHWDRYTRTGVVQVLVVSGQQLSLLGMSLLWVLLRLRVRYRHGVLAVAVLLTFYGLLVGGEPPVLRAVIVACVTCVASFLSRRVNPANAFALSWVVIGLINPSQLLHLGTHLSFLCIAFLLSWIHHSASRKSEENPRGGKASWGRRLLWFVAKAYAVHVALSLFLAPLLMSHYHTLNIVGWILSPPVVLLTTLAMIAGFLALGLSTLAMPLGMPCAWVTRVTLQFSDLLVEKANQIPYGFWWVGGFPDWWLWVFYTGGLSYFLLLSLKPHGPKLALAGLLWLCLGLGVQHFARTSEELRVTFLAVGHGGCVVLETPQDQTLLYDVGTSTGPRIAQRAIAPFLWKRGIHHIEDVFLSHADLDHYNALLPLLDRFTINRIHWTPSFSQRTTPALQLTLQNVRARGLDTRVLVRGNRILVGDVTLEVLHPPAEGPPGNENSRSLVLLVEYAGRRILLTGDLEGEGMEQVLALPMAPVDVLMAPHHGSLKANTARFAAWARPRVVISAQGAERLRPVQPSPYADLGAIVLDTWTHGAVTVRCSPHRLSVETFVTKQHWESKD